MYHLTEAYLLASYITLLGAYFGALLLGTGLVPSLVFQTLDEANSARFLRAYWLRFHQAMVIGGLVFTIIASLAAGATAIPIQYALLVVALLGLMTICAYIALRLIPQINAARDRGDEAAFSTLHRADIVMVALVMLLCLGILAALIYVLPGQFTFWPTAA